MRARPSFFALLGMLGVHSALVAFLTWPLARHLDTHLPATSGACEFDPLYMGWTLAHQSRALLTAPATLSDGGIYQPAADSWLYGETSSGALPLFLPVFLVSGNPTLALNAVFLAGVVLTAVALQAVVLDWTGSWLAGLVAAWTFLTTRWVLWEHLPCAPSHAMLPALPLIVALASRRVLGVRAWLGLLLLVILQCLTNLVYVAPVVLATLAVLAVVRLARAPRSGAALGAVTAAAVLALAPLYTAHRSVWLANPSLAEQTVWPLSGPLEPALPREFLDYGPMAIAAPAMLLILFGLAMEGASMLRGAQSSGTTGRGRAWLHALLWTASGVVVAVLLAFGAGGRWLLTMAWLEPSLAQTLRFPLRLSTASLCGLCLLAGLSFAELERLAEHLPGLERRMVSARALIGAAVLAATYASYSRADGVRSGLSSSYPLAVAPRPSPALVDQLRGSGGPLLELPVPPAVRGRPPGTWPTPHARAMYRAIFHRRRLVNGYSGYWPSGFVERMALAARLPEPAALAELRSETGLELVLVHLDDLDERTRQLWLDVAREHRADLFLVWREGSDLLFRADDRR